MPWSVYMLRCGNGDIYTGVTTDIERRLREHQTRQGGRFTRMRQPIELVYHESATSESEAKRREAQLKTWPRVKKLALIEGNVHTLKRA